MIGEKIDKTKLNIPASKELLAVFDYILHTPQIVLAIAGESGSGKTYLAAALQLALEEKGKKSLILHMDDFFHLPPAQNHQQRLMDIRNVGPQEVNFKRLNEIIRSFKEGVHTISVPQVHYYENTIAEITLSLIDIDVLIIEGTYAFYLDNTDFHIYMSRNYKETRELRQIRNRGDEVNDPFIEDVLKLEHELITAKKSKANAWIDFNHNLRYHV